MIICAYLTLALGSIVATCSKQCLLLVQISWMPPQPPPLVCSLPRVTSEVSYDDCPSHRISHVAASIKTLQQRLGCGSQPSRLPPQGLIHLPQPVAWLTTPLVAYVRQQNVSTYDPCFKLCPALTQLEQACLVRPPVKPAARLSCDRGCCRH